MPNVKYQRPEYQSLTPRWTLIRDVLSGDKAIKDKRTDYLPKPNPTDTSDENTERYKQYLARAIFYGVTSRTLRGFLGEVFSVDPVITVPPALDLMKVDADGGGLSLDQLARKALSHAIAFGRGGLLTDYPVTNGPASVAELDAGKIRPTIKIYDPWDIINWREETVGSKKMLTLVVLSESEVIDDDGFVGKLDPYYRVLRLDGGVYKSQVWYFDETKQDFVMESEEEPKDGAGAPWNEIPFQFFGPENNEPNPNLPPLYDMAVLNLGHYRNSADYEEACYILGQPTPYFAGLTEAWVRDVLKGQVQLGARAAVPLPAGGTAGLLQVTANTMAMEAMEHKEAQMKAIGAKLMEPQKVQRTATEVSTEESANTSLLATAANNVAEALTCCLVWAGQFIGVIKTADAEKADGTVIDYSLNTEFSIGSLVAVDVQALIAAWQANAISKTEMREKLRDGGWAFQDDEEFQAEIDSEGLALGVPVGGPASAAAQAAKAAADALKQKQQAGAPAKSGLPA